MLFFVMKELKMTVFMRAMIENWKYSILGKKNSSYTFFLQTRGLAYWLLRLLRWDERKREAEEAARRQRWREQDVANVRCIVGRERSEQSAFRTPSFVPCLHRPRYFISIHHYFFASLYALLTRENQKRRQRLNNFLENNLAPRLNDTTWKIGMGT